MFHLDNPLSAPTLRLTPFQRGDNYPDTGGCHECNTTKQDQVASDFLRSLYRKGALSQAELENRLGMLEQLQLGKLAPDIGLVKSAL
uniref:Uncharacterized protein n=1 Tax=Acidithiobacillus sulfuriphilus TaxID=1867749 RepID=A0A3M8RWE4_9PROT|nr:hypothetical protein [Acidithiobacillus sulfuriphilus]RNF72671.1 hypothetical protein EC580_01165 [Acidithiobacillus sulfuriphilus]